jgi:galactose mutarotase-like enzyme
MTLPADRVELSADGATAALSLFGAEPVSWRVGGRELIWHGDPAHWPRHAPILFPVIGESSGGQIRVEGRSYLMPRHGFARDLRFTLVEQTEKSAKLRLTASEATRAHFPFDFAFDVAVSLGPDSLSLTFEVANADEHDMPYALGFHPAFPWPLDGGDRQGHAISFETEEGPAIPDITGAGLLRPGSRRLPFRGRTLPLDPSLFAHDALVLLDARSRSLRFTASSGAALGFIVEDFPHFALWTKPTAPFLSIEAWTGHADPEGFSGELSERPSMKRLPPGATAQHRVVLSWRPATQGLALPDP